MNKQIGLMRSEMIYVFIYTVSTALEELTLLKQRKAVKQIG